MGIRSLAYHRLADLSQILYPAVCSLFYGATGEAPFKNPGSICAISTR